MKAIFTILFFLFGCTTDPQPIVAGKDECYQCKMGIADERFGTEIITHKGKVYKFDDVICMVKFLNSGNIDTSKVIRKLFVNYLKKDFFIESQDAVFLLSNDLHSPMNGNAAAFSNRDDAMTIKKDKAGELLTWNELAARMK